MQNYPLETTQIAGLSMNISCGHILYGEFIVPFVWAINRPYKKVFPKMVWAIYCLP